MISRTAKQARIFACQHSATVTASDMGYGVLAVFLFHHVHQHTQRRWAQFGEAAIEQGVTGVVTVKNISLREPFAVKQVENGAIATNQEHTRWRAAKN